MDENGVDKKSGRNNSVGLAIGTLIITVLCKITSTPEDRDSILALYISFSVSTI